jgi:hypothetical protein
MFEIAKVAYYFYDNAACVVTAASGLKFGYQESYRKYRLRNHYRLAMALGYAQPLIEVSIRHLPVG